ncbi:MAG: ABC transporter permease [Lysinibacillus sp.]
MSKVTGVLGRLNGNSSVFKKLNISSTGMAFIVLLATWLLSALLIGGFETKEHNIQVLQTAAFLGIVAAGQTIVVMMAGIDLSVSSIITLSAVVTSSFVSKLGVDPVFAIVLGLLISTGIGFINAMGVTLLKLPPMIMTIAMVSIIEGSMLIFTNGTPPSGTSPVISNLANSTWFFGLPNVVFIWLLVSIFVFWFLNKSVWGRQIYSLGTNEKTSVLSGISVAKMNIIGYCLSGFFAGLAGILLFGYMGSSYLTMGAPYQLYSIAAVVLGGTSILGGRGNYLGTIAGALLIIILKDVLTVVNISMAGREVFLGLLILIILFAYGRERKQR